MSNIATEVFVPIIHKSLPVVTTELLAQFYSVDVSNIQVNFTRNKDRFVEGKHFFKSVGDELKQLRLTLSKSQKGWQISSMTRSLILWTERGAARHAKMLESDQAWEVFEKLEDCYFNQRPAEWPADGRITPEQKEAIKQLVLARSKSVTPEHQARAAKTLWSAIKNHFGRSYKEIDAAQYGEALSLVVHLPLTGELLPARERDDRESTDNVMLLTDNSYRTQALDYVDDLLTRCNDYAEAKGIDVTKWNPANYELAASGLLADLLRHTRAELSFDSSLRPVLKVLPAGALFVSPSSDEAMRGLISRVVSTETLMGMMSEGLARLDRERKSAK
ncbi:hypothetical protein AW765_004570 [Escherichia coli]|nr:hypothetical protein [Escherichia coli]EFJ8793503.1 hypothetical protein [Escherichia coli]